MEKIDVAVVGAGGIVGAALLAELAEDGREVYGFERHGTFGRETSDRNSEVVHAGIYYETGSFKAKLCVEGKEMIDQICRENNLPYKRLGKLIVAVDESEVPALEKLMEKGKANGVGDLRVLDKKEAKELEPNAEAAAAVYSPSTGITSAHHLMKYFLAKAKSNSGGIEPIIYNAEVIGIDRTPEGYKLTVNGFDEPVLARVVINSAGLNSDKVAEMAGIDIEEAGYRLYYCKGEYFKVSSRHKGKISRLVYPVPEHAGLGVHATLDIAGEIKLGPNAVYMQNHTIDYSINETHKSEFFESAKRFLPFLEYDDLQPDQAGIRPKLYGPDMPVRDFVMQEESARGLPGFITLAGIESPGLTAAPAIAKHVGDMVNEMLK